MADGSFKDHFSGHAQAYASFRPLYPQELVQWLSAQCNTHGLAWDAGTGNGQLAASLSKYFLVVHATDASANQIAAAHTVDGVRFAVEAAEECSLDDNVADLVTVAQALHWFDHSRFFKEVKRVLKPGGLFAAVSYGLLEIDPQVDEVVNWFYDQRVGDYWPPERRMVENQYRSIDLPLSPVNAPDFTRSINLSLAGLLNYVGTWSAVQRCRNDTGQDPLPELQEKLTAIWTPESSSRAAQWRFSVLAGRSER